MTATAKKGTNEEQEDLYITYTHTIDRYNKIRHRVLLTPAVCDECGLDFCWFQKYPVWNECSEKERNQLKDWVKAHKQAMHGPESQLIIKRSELPEKWLGDHPGGRKVRRPGN